MKIKKKVINNVPVTFIITHKFKSVAGKLYFKRLADKEKMTTSVFLRNILIESTKKYDTNEKLNINTLENYDAYYSASNSRKGNYITNSFYFETLSDKYTEKGNLEKVIDTFCEIIFNPNVKNGAFDKKSFNNNYTTIKLSIESQKENQRSYAESRILNYLNQDKAYSYDVTIDELKKITPSSLYENYISMLNESEVELIIAGDVDPSDPSFEKILNNVKKNRKYEKDLYIYNEDESDDYKCIKEQGYGTQNVLYMVSYLKNMSNYERNYVMPIYNAILGGTGSSRLYNSVREKKSLAYYCFSRMEKDDNMLMVISGIEKENYEEATKTIKKEIEKMSFITDEELRNVKKELTSSLIESQDKIGNLISRKRVEEIFDLPEIDEFLEKLNGVTKEEVEKLNDKIDLKINYFLEGRDNNG